MQELELAQFVACLHVCLPLLSVAEEIPHFGETHSEIETTNQIIQVNNSPKSCYQMLSKFAQVVSPVPNNIQYT